MSSELESIQPLKTPRRKFSQSAVIKIAIAALLLIVMLVAAIPSYLQGQGVGTQPIPVTNLKTLRSLSQKGLTVSGWTTSEQRQVSIGGHKWSFQVLQQNGEDKASLLLRAQNDTKTQPEVDWVDVQGVTQWRSRDRQTVRFQVAATEVKASFFKAFTKRQTFAVMQWYAWQTGGSPAPKDWFFADQRSQLQGQRLPWVAVNLQIPIDPLSDLELAKPEAIALGESIQKALIDNVLTVKE
jgi:cyanoexosortase B-associated protein